MKKSFTYIRQSNSGRNYAVKFSIEVTPQGFASIDAEFSLHETLSACLVETREFINMAMRQYSLGVAEFGDRVNRGAPTAPINKAGQYFNIDGKLYRHDKHIMGVWKAPASDLLRILYQIE